MPVAHAPFGRLPDGRPVTRWTLVHAGLEMEVLDWGGIVAALRVPDAAGRVANIVLGLPTLEAYLAGSPYLGAIIGRVSNRIAGARFTLDGRTHRLAANDGPNTLHGGREGFDRRLWEAAPEPCAGGVRLVLTRTSPDGEEGFPGTVRLRVAYTLTDAREFVVEQEAEAEAPTPLALTHHGYFNLAGEGSGSVEGHELQVAASRYLPVDATLVPLPVAEPVAGTPFDFRAPTALGARLRDADPQLLRARGYDHCLLIDGPEGRLRPAARLRDPASGRVMELLTTQPALQLYSGNFLDGTLVGPSGRAYRQGDGLCLEAQQLPDAPNRPDAPGAVLRPGRRHHSVILHRFG